MLQPSHRTSLIIALLFVAHGCSWSQEVSLPMLPRKAYQKIGRLQTTFYSMVDERKPAFANAPKASALANEDGKQIAMVSASFKAKLEIEGVGKLADGRVVSFAGFRSANGAGAANNGREAYYQIAENAPFGFGVENYRLIPYRTAAVNPRQVLIGSVLYIPQAHGALLPSGETHDGFFFAHDTGRAIKRDRIDLFVGSEEDVDNSFSRAVRMRNANEIEVYLVQEPIAGAMRKRYREDYEYLPRPALNEMLAKPIDSFLREVSGREKDLNRRLAIYSERARGTPYALFCLGEGADGKYDRDPLVDFARADCMTFCEQILAMTISGSFEEMFANLLRLRYRQGEIGFTTRNHYTHADWVPNNAWLLTEATVEIGAQYCADMSKVIDRPAFFHKFGLPDSELTGVPPAQTMTIKYIPVEYLPAIKNNLRGGEIASIIQKMPGIFSAHMGFIIRDRYDNVLFRHASSRPEANQVVDQFFDEVVAQIKQSENRVGMAFIRLRPDFVALERAGEP
ncbi:MAG: N-acetylmuramoyl-L-alanine amidase-like domain-containing protein [bacterium]